MTTGEKLQKLRRENNFTQEDLADILSVSRQTIYNWESNNVYPETEKIIALAKLYRCSVEYLLMDDVEEPRVVSTTSNDNKVIDEKPKKQRNMAITAFSIITTSICALFLGLFFVSTYAFGSLVFNGYECAFKIFNPEIAVFWILAFICIVANLGLSITNIVIYKKGIFIANKSLNIATFILMAVPLSIAIAYSSRKPLPVAYVEMAMLLGVTICQVVIKPDNSKSENNKIKVFSTVSALATIILAIVLAISCFQPHYDYYRYIFEIKSWYICTFGIINLLCMLANIAIGFVNIYLNKEILYKVNKYLTLAVSLLTFMPFLNGDGFSYKAYEIGVIAFLTLLSIFTFYFIQKDSKYAKRSDNLGICCSHLNAAILIFALIIIDFCPTLYFLVRSAVDGYRLSEIHMSAYGHFYYVLIQYFFVLGIALSLFYPFFENRILSIVQKGMNVAALLYFVIWNVVTIALAEAKVYMWFFYVTLSLLIVIIALEIAYDVFKVKRKKKENKNISSSETSNL